MRVEEVDARTAPVEQLLAIHAIEAACEAELRPGEPGRSAEDAVAYWRHPPSTHTRYRWLVERNGAPVGTAGLYVHTPSAVYLELFVTPGERRDGVGTALLEAVVATARRLDLLGVYGHHATPGGAAFAASVGAVDGQRDVRSLLDLRSAALTEPTLPDGWRLASWLGGAPDDVVESYVRARAAMNDAPSPDGVEVPDETVERIRSMEESLALRNRELRLTVAIDPHAEIGAFTDLRLSAGSTVAFTDDTGTVARHRGRGLATAVKLESLRLLRADHPEVEFVTTTNAEDNRAIRRINEQIGFVPVATLTTAVLTL
jgi:GNAT superfamily N-acetyltransferase